MKTLVFASAAHEFRNPLNAILASLELMEPHMPAIPIGNYFTIAKKCSNLMLYLVKDILDFSQLEAKSIILNYTRIDLLKVLNDCIEVLDFKAKDKGIDLIIEKNLSIKNIQIVTD